MKMETGKASERKWKRYSPDKAPNVPPFPCDIGMEFNRFPIEKWVEFRLSSLFVYRLSLHPVEERTFLNYIRPTISTEAPTPHSLFRPRRSSTMCRNLSAPSAVWADTKRTL